MEQLKEVGNIQSLLNFSTSAPNYCYRKLFQNCLSLIKAPSFLATSAGGYSYGSTLGKTSISKFPKIAATTLGEYCCYYMFEECPLTTIPNLTQTTLGSYCYSEMFHNCKSLIKTGEILATTLNRYSFRHMFYGCNNLLYRSKNSSNNKFNASML